MQHTTRPALSPVWFRTSLALIFLFSLAFFFAETNAQDKRPMPDDCSGGTYYLLAFPDTTTNTWDSRFPAQLIRTNTKAFNFYIYSPVQQQLRIGRANGAGEVVSINEGEIIEYNTEQVGVPLITVLNRPQTNVVKIEAQYPVIVYGYMLTTFGTEAYTAIPVEQWGKEYYAAAWPGEIVRDVFPNGEFNYKAIPKQGEGEILIIAAQDSTRVTISPNAVLRDCAGCAQVTLKAGEAYLVQSTTDTSARVLEQPDIGGTFIQASKPIGVISGNPRLMHNKGAKPALAENSFMNMAIEWVPPVEQLGTEFVFLPTWDDRRQREGLDLEESRQGEHVRIFGVEEGTQAYSVNDQGDTVPTTTATFDAGGFTGERITTPVARGFRTMKPTFAVSSPEAVIKFNGTTTWGATYIGASYLSWSSYMVEMVPREQWTSFAPVRAPSLPTSMIHYLNLVTDTNNQFNVYYRQGNSPRQLFPFNRGVVPGTDLIWGSIQLNKGVDYMIEGDDGARFTGYAYGSYRGQEQYRPGGAKERDGKDASISGGGTSDPSVLHPSEYEEDIAMMYGFPLAPSRCVLAPPDEYDIRITQHCDEMLVEITARNPETASGIRSIELLRDSSENVRLEFVEPSNPLDIRSLKITRATLRIVPINPERDARAVVIIRDRSRESRRWRVAYKWEAERVNVNPAGELDLGYVTAGTPAGEKLVTLTNPLPTKDIYIKRLNFVFGTQGFRITRTQPDFRNDGTDSVRLAPGQSMKVWIDITPEQERDYEDSLRIKLGCTEMTLPVRVSAAIPCTFANDIDFGTLAPGQTHEHDLKVCNKGAGEVTFQEPWLTWLKDQAGAQGFNVAASEIDKLKGLTLRKDQCVEITVTFTAPDQPGAYLTTGRFWANTRDCRDTTIWRANVIKPYCLMVPDLSFGLMQIDQSRTLDLDVCNQGPGDITFQDPWLTWQGNDFGVAQSEIDKLKGLTLRTGECVTIRVAFSAGDVGAFRTTARFWANTRQCRDTSVWSVRVYDPIGGAGEEAITGYGIGSITPNPFSGETRVDFTLGRAGRAAVEVYNGDGKRIATLLNDHLGPGEHHVYWDAEGVAAGTYIVRIRSGEWSAVRPVVLVR